MTSISGAGNFGCMDLPDKACENCGLPFKPRRRDQRCCSKPCITTLSNQERGVRVHALAIKECEKCGIKYEVTTQYGVSKQRFCSTSCSSQNLWDSGEHPRSVRKIEKHCRICDEVIVLNPSLREVRFTCSLECRGKWQTESGLWSGENSATWKGGTSTFWKAKARERDDYTCQVDGCDIRHEGKGTHAHHKLPLAAGGSDDLDNLITLCNQHHRTLEHQLLMTIIERCPKMAAKIVEEMYAPG